MTKYGMIIDINKCVGCYNCFLSCRDEFAGNDYPGYSAPQPMSGMNWMRVIEKERGEYPKVKVDYTPMPCMHCADAPCIKAAENDAVYRKNGMVIIDPVKAKGQKQIVNSCPYRVIEWNEELELPQKCNFCAHLLDAGEKEPRCVESCPSGALIFGDTEDPKSEVSKLIASGKTEVMHPEYNTEPQVRYIGLPRKFVAGTVIYGDKREVAAGAKVTLSGNGENKETKTNGFGDFEFEGLPDNIDYKVTVQASGYQDRTMKARTSKDVYLGEIALKK
jgi:Fe-S-cluster-containing dehydrogenase component